VPIRFYSPSEFSSSNEIFKYVKIVGEKKMKKQNSEDRNIVEVCKTGKLCDHEGII
jgi:hypothetical protein